MLKYKLMQRKSMLDDTLLKKINDFVYAKPRTVLEVAQMMDKNWRTADRYVEKIAKEQGTISIRTFRGGTRGALKIVFWNNVEKIHSTEFQERIFKKIESGREKEDFSPMDIYQYIDCNKKKAFLEVQADENAKIEQDIVSLIRGAKEQIFIFSGNLSWANAVQGKVKVLDVLEEAAKRKVAIKILTRVDIASMSNIEKVLPINEKLGREAIEVRHCEQPLRCIMIDNKVARLKEIKDPVNYKKGELAKKMFIFYEIYDSEWLEWLQKVFWNFFRPAMPASKRIEEINSIKVLKI